MGIFDKYLGSVLKSVEDGMLTLEDKDGKEFVASWAYQPSSSETPIALVVDGISVPEND